MSLEPRRIPASFAALIVTCLAVVPAAKSAVAFDSGKTAAPDAACGGPAVAIGAVQGRGERSPMVGRRVLVEGVVVGDYEGPQPALRGFYLQDPRGDGDPATSDAIFVFNGSRDEVRVGDRVRVEGEVEEYQGQTQLARGALEECARGQRMTPVEITLPLPDPDWLERYEGMLVRFPQELYVTGNHNLGRFGEVALSSGGRLPQPTNVARPGEAARAVEAANARNRILLDDANNAQNPEPIPFGRGGAPLSAENPLRGGDRITGLTGVLTWTWAGNAASGNAWRVRPTSLEEVAQPAFVAANPRSAAPAVGGNLHVASFNVLNYFNTFGEQCTAGQGGAVVECRGAGDAREFERQWRRTVAAIAALGADVVGVLEIENDGYGPGSALAHLVARLNEAAGAEHWRFVHVDAATGRRNALGTDAIKVGLLYRADRVRPTGRTAVLDTRQFVTGGDAAPMNRPSLAQAFERVGGGRLVVSISHLKSKGSACEAPDAGDGQGNCNRVRTAAARELAGWLGRDPTGTGERNVLILGDLNAYAEEDPVRELLDAGYTDLLAREQGEPAYTYQFSAQWGRLDHALASAALARLVRGAAVWHINADEASVLDYGTRFKSAAQQAELYRPDPFRSSDHDPVLVGLELGR